MERTLMLRDLAIGLNFHFPSVIRYLGHYYMGEHLPRKSLLTRVTPFLDDGLMTDLRRVLFKGSPAVLQGESSHANFWKYKRYSNHVSVTKDVKRTFCTLNKDDKNRFLLTFPNWLARFVPHLHLTPTGLVTIEGKKDRFVFDGTFAIDETA